jgi:GNAT superfamily N-acetyltransferase
MTIEVTDTKDPHVESVIGSGLRRYNVDKSGIDDSRSLNVVVRDPASGDVIGGITGRTSMGLLFIDLFYLPQDARGAGLGTRVIRAAEDEARRRGCVSSFLITVNIQAPGFYERNGYTRMGAVDCAPGIQRVMFTKRL